MVAAAGLHSTQLLYAALLGVIVALESPGLRRAVDRIQARRRGAQPVIAGSATGRV